VVRYQPKKTGFASTDSGHRRLNQQKGKSRRPSFASSRHATDAGDAAHGGLQPLVHIEREPSILATKSNKPTIKAADAKMIAGIAKNLASMATLTLAAQQYSLAQLTAIYQADSAAIDATDTAHATWQQKVADEQATHAITAKVTRALRSFLLGYYGDEAVAILGDFGLSAPKSTATTNVATKALAAAKGKATRAARGTTGSVQKKAVTGNVTSVVLTSTPGGTQVQPSAPTGTSPTANAATTPATPAPAATPAAAKPVTPS
jgi:hypothetical protein